MSENTNDDQSKAEALLQQSKEQKRHTTDVDADPDGDDDGDLAAAVADAYQRLEDDELHPNLSVRDGDLSALIDALEATGELEDVAARANGRLDRDAPTETKAALLKALLRLGLREVADEELEAWADGKREYLSSSADVM
jgi:hypothetical protein